MVRLKFFSLLVVVLIIVFYGQSSWGQTVRAYVDRNPIVMDETVRLVVELQGPSTGETPDFSVLEKDFDVLGNSQNSQTSIINGQTSTSTRWVVTLAPKHAGNLTIPAVSVGAQTSAPLIVKVQKHPTGPQGAADKDIFLEATVEPREPYVQSQIIYTLRLYHAVPLREGQIEDPQISRAIVERIGEDHSFESIRDGRRYQVIERRYLVIPQASGSMKIPSVLFSGHVPDGRSSRSVFEEMFGNRPGVFGGGFQSTRLVRARSPEITLNVEEIPSTMQGGAWLPARELSIAETWSMDLALPLQVGEPITRTITIHAKGLTGEQLPELPKAEETRMKFYPDQPTITTTFDGSWAVGTREQKIAIVPTQPGSLTIPEIRIRWWNLDTRKSEEAVLPARTVSVLGTSASQPSTQPSGKEMVDLNEAQSPSSPTPIQTLPRSGNREALDSPWKEWPVMTGLLFALWLLTTAGWWYDRRKLKIQQDSLHEEKKQRQESIRAVRASVKQACMQNEPKQAREALLKWASVTWTQGVHRNLGSVAQRFTGQAHESSEAQRAIRDLDRNLYAARPEPWNGTRFWEIVASEMKSLEKHKGTVSGQNNQGLAPLYLHSSSSRR